MGCLKLTYEEKERSLFVSANNFGCNAKKSLECNHFEARMYDPLIGRWLVVDPYRQFYSSYLGMGNNPIVHVDKDGRWVNFVIGGLIGGGTEIVAQVASGMLQGKDFSSAIHDIDWVDVGVSTAEGVLTSGASATRTIIVKGTALAVRSAVDGKFSDGEIKVFKYDQGVNNNKSTFDAVTDFSAEIAAVAIDEFLNTGNLTQNLTNTLVRQTVQRGTRELVKIPIDSGADFLKDYIKNCNCTVLDEVVVESERSN